MLSWIIGTAIAMAPTAPTDCGASRHAAEIASTRRLLRKEVRIEPYVGEMPTATGHPACARLTFSIDPRGKAVAIRVPESSGDFLLVLDARRALDNSRFIPQRRGQMTRFTLVYRAIENRRAPPAHPPDR